MEKFTQLLTILDMKIMIRRKELELEGLNAINRPHHPVSSAAWDSKHKGNGIHGNAYTDFEGEGASITGRDTHIYNGNVVINNDNIVIHYHVSSDIVPH